MIPTANLPAHVADALARDARLLRGRQRCPVNLRPVVDRLGMRIEYRTREEIGAEGALLRNRDDEWVIAIPDRDLSRPRTRFTIAHEIGHRLLDLYGVPRPTSRGDYWRTEALCNHFAGQLLVPDSAVDWVAAATGASPAELLRRASLASRRAAVSSAALSHRLFASLEGCAFCQVRLAPPGGDVVGVVDWALEQFPWLGVRQNRHIDGEHFLAEPLLDQQRAAVGRIVSRQLKGLPAAILRRRDRIWLVGVEPAPSEAGSGHLAQLSLLQAG